MAEQTAIEWCDHTFNPWSGCAKVAAGCANCYAEVNYSVKMRGVKWGPNGTRVLASDAMWKEPVKWNRQAAAAPYRCDNCDEIIPASLAHLPHLQTNGIAARECFGRLRRERPRVFCASLADVFEDWAGPMLNHKGDRLEVAAWSGRDPAMTMADCRRRLFELIDATPHLDWLLLTKRPENIRKMWPAVSCRSQEQADDRNERGELYRQNVWLITSIAEQRDADKNIPELLRCRDLCSVLGVSAEPLISSIDLRTWTDKCSYYCDHVDQYPDGHRPERCAFDWLIVGGESGPHARPCNVAWIRSIVEQCRAATVPCFVKQLGARIGVANDSASEWPRQGDEWIIYDQDNLTVWRHQGDIVEIRLTHPKGGDWDEWPADLRVRELPKPEAAV